MNRSTAALFIVGLILLGVGINYTNCGLLKNEVITSPTNNEPKEVELDEGYDVVLVIGQSNTHSGQGSDPNLDGPHSEIFQLGRFETDDYKVIPASEPLHHWTAMNDFIGFALSFAKEYVTHENSQRKVLIVPCEASGTGFLNNNWNPGDSYFEDALDRTNFVLNTFKGSRLIAILWHQGEAEGIGVSKYM